MDLFDLYGSRSDDDDQHDDIVEPHHPTHAATPAPKQQPTAPNEQANAPDEQIDDPDAGPPTADSEPTTEAAPSPDEKPDRFAGHIDLDNGDYDSSGKSSPDCGPTNAPAAAPDPTSH